MEKLEIGAKTKAQNEVERQAKELSARLIACPTGMCPVEAQSAFVKVCLSQSCGKCTPCRVGLNELETLIDSVLDGNATLDTVALIESTATAIYDSADCAIGYTAAEAVLEGLKQFKDDYISHITNGVCLNAKQQIPCVSGCPAQVDIPGYIALTREGRYADAVRLIRKDNPFPVVCGHICEHPCEFHCRRSMVDAPVNIRGIKNYATEKAGFVPCETPAEKTGKKVAVIGGGPSGLTASYYLSLMGHEVTVYEKRNMLGGMLRYGIPNYRLLRTELQRDIDNILSLGVTVVEKGVESAEEFESLRKQFDAVYVAIGAHSDKKLRIEGEDAEGVISAVKLLRGIGDGEYPDFSGKNVVVVGGGNVAMDCTRTAKRLNAASVNCVYRRRAVDMTALPEEVEGARAEGCEITELVAPVSVETENGRCTALIGQPQIIGEYDKNGRPAPRAAKLPTVRIPADVIVVAIGQDIESVEFAKAGMPVNRGAFISQKSANVEGMNGVFVGGDCASGPATVIRAIEAGKVAARSIDTYLGYSHPISVDIEIPEPKQAIGKCGRINMAEVPAKERATSVDAFEIAMTDEEAEQETSRCLRCDKYGYGCFRGGRKQQW